MRSMMRAIRPALSRIIASGLAAALFPIGAVAQSISLSGLDGQSAVVSAAEVAAMPHVTLTARVEGQTHAWRGVPLSDLLAKVGAPAGPALRGKELADVVLVQARDGYVVALALAETDPAVRKDQILLADSVDGHALPDTAGPFRLVVEGDQRGARLARMVSAITLRRVTP